MVTILIVYNSFTYNRQKLSEFTLTNTAHKMMFSIADVFSKCDQIRSFLQILLHLLKKSAMENFIFCAVQYKSN